MLSCKNIVVIILVSSLLTGCMEQKIAFKFSTDVNRNFFKEIPGIGNVTYLDSQVTRKANDIQIYRSSFKEKYIEKDDLLEYTELNDSSKIKNASYMGITGYSQDLYLIKYDFAFGAPGIPVSAAVYFSVKHNGKGQTIGIVPCYFGIINTKKSVIAFETDLTIKKQNGHFYLKAQKKGKDKRGLLFMPADFPENPVTQSFINIEKIVRLDANKVGGNKPLVFNISNIFRDSNALQFHYFKTLSLTQ